MLCGSSATVTECMVEAFPGVMEVCKDLGIRGCFRGLGARALMIGSLTALQFAFYEKFKRAVSISINVNQVVSPESKIKYLTA